MTVNAAAPKMVNCRAGCADAHAMSTPAFDVRAPEPPDPLFTSGPTAVTSVSEVTSVTEVAGVAVGTMVGVAAAASSTALRSPSSVGTERKVLEVGAPIVAGAPSAATYAARPMHSIPVDASVSVVFPAYQEQDFITSAVTDVVDGLRTMGVAFEVIVVENGSTDGTRAEADGLAARYGEVRSMSIDAPDYGRALRHGLLAATKDYVVNFDVDLYDLDFAARAVSQMHAPGGPSIVVGSKRGDGSVDNRHWTRKVVTGVFSGLLRYGFGLRVSDTHGMKAMRRADVLPVAERCQFGTDLFDTELVLRTERAGFKTGELPVVIEEKRPARTPIVSRIVRTVRGLARLRVALWRDRA
jgi:glycosyltransferase AglD